MCDSIDLCCPFDVNIVHLKTVNEEDVGSPSKLHDTLNQHLYKNDSTDLNTSWLTDTAIIYTNTCMWEYLTKTLQTSKTSNRTTISKQNWCVCGCVGLQLPNISKCNRDFNLSGCKQELGSAAAALRKATPNLQLSELYSSWVNCTHSDSKAKWNELFKPRKLYSITMSKLHSFKAQWTLAGWVQYHHLQLLDLCGP